MAFGTQAKGGFCRCECEGRNKGVIGIGTCEESSKRADCVNIGICATQYSARFLM